MVNITSIPSVKLNNGLSIPIVGLGTWQPNANGSMYKTVRIAIDSGYRHFDCAYSYPNSEEIGKAINDSINEGKVNRGDIYIVSKVWMTYFRRERVMVCVKKILLELNILYLDLCLLHWPMSFNQSDTKLFPIGLDGKVIDGKIDYLEAWKGLEDCVKLSLVKSIGISNFASKQIDRLLKSANVMPVINQVEIHPYLPQKALKEFCEERKIILTAHSPLGNPGSRASNLLIDPVINRIAAKYNKNAGQILIKFQVQRGIIVIPKSLTLERIRTNIEVFDFDLTKLEIEEMEALNCNNRFCNFEWLSKYCIEDLPDYPFKDPNNF